MNTTEHSNKFSPFHSALKKGLMKVLQLPSYPLLRCGCENGILDYDATNQGRNFRTDAKTCRHSEAFCISYHLNHPTWGKQQSYLICHKLHHNVCLTCPTTQYSLTNIRSPVPAGCFPLSWPLCSSMNITLLPRCAVQTFLLHINGNVIFFMVSRKFIVCTILDAQGGQVSLHQKALITF